MAGAVGFMVLFVSFWTLIVVIFDVVIGHGLYHQLRATQFASTQGRIISSEVLVENGSDGALYRPKVSYEYSVKNVPVRGEAIRYSESSSSDRWAYEFIADHPVGKIVDVHYDPSDNSDAVLIPGIQGSDLFLLMFMTPFNVVMLGGWYFLGSYFLNLIVPKRFRRPCRFSDDGYELRIMVNRTPLLAVIAVCMLGLCFVSIFIVGIGSSFFDGFGSGFHPGFSAMVAVWTIILSITGLATARYAVRNWTGINDIVVHRFGKKITLPRNSRRKEAHTFPLNEIKEITVDGRTKINSDSDQQVEFLVQLHRTPGKHSKSANHRNVERLATFWQEGKAERFANWLVEDVLKLENEIATSESQT